MAAMNGAAILRNPDLLGFRPLDGGPDLPVADWPEGCPRARAAGAPTSLAAIYAPGARALPPAGARMQAAGAWLPYLRWADMGEGGTPLIPLVGPPGFRALAVKAEWMNPTGSHKDRMSPLVVARAQEIGAPGVVCASSGNAGISLAAYAARAGIGCAVVVTPAVPAAVRRALHAHGARVLGVWESLERWRLAARLAAEGWYPATNHALPPVGSSAWGVEGYRTLAFEIATEMPNGVDAILVPTARGDTIWGLAAGFATLRDAGLWPHAGPRLIAIEPFPRLEAVLAGTAHSTDSFPGSTRQASTAGGTTTDQAVRAVRDTRGWAVVVSDEAAEAAQAELATRHGLFLELCAAAGFAALPRVASRLEAGARIVIIGTSAAARDADAPAPPPLELVE
ncbi:PLP-dependent lyase/thiolase [Roseomonas sp. AR75]|uniref:PLP-dependent lyase/thiolase n=1 Tax=Roseomonas sp. AR75 TaxID=2562311 RepID=UPI0010C1563B|nr:PLP-dependent lyase/thiolase [Roseomonas sp. AR75]